MNVSGEVTADRSIWRLARRPVGMDFAPAFDFENEAIPDLGPGDVLIRNHYIGMDAGTRNWLNAREDGFDPPLPLGTAMVGILVGTIEASEHPDYIKGGLVRAYGQWSDFSVVNPAAGPIHVLDPDVEDIRQYIGLLGPSGWTSYFGVLDVGKPKPGETFVVSAAAGSTGSIAGQVARLAGCRTVGITGSDEKIDWITSELGFDAGVNYKSGDLTAQLAEACPNGIDVYFDNVAGPILDAVLPNMALRGRIALSGLIDSYNKEGPVPGPYKFDYLLHKRVTISGFFSPDYFHLGHESDARMRQWMNEGAISFRFDETNGVENTLDAYTKMFTGDNIGKSIVKV
ncbi:NADP-dependent oxidoreductase [bacterium]|nr:NADP-dependent oxidoreductase [bacterium]